MSEQHGLDDMEHEADAMQRQADEVGKHVDEAREQWEAAKHDPEVPGAAGDPDRAEEGPVKEATYPNKRPDEES